MSISACCVSSLGCFGALGCSAGRPRLWPRPSMATDESGPYRTGGDVQGAGHQPHFAEPVLPVGMWRSQKHGHCLTAKRNQKTSMANGRPQISPGVVTRAKIEFRNASRAGGSHLATASTEGNARYVPERVKESEKILCPANTGGLTALQQPRKMPLSAKCGS
jgi:hypothetical protein